MKYLKAFTLFIIILSQTTFGFDDEPAPMAELFIQNLSTTKDIFVKVIPVGFVFNGKITSGVKDFRYSSEASKPFNFRENHIFGGYRKLHKITGSFTWESNGFLLNHDLGLAQGSACDSIIGFGKYRIEFWDIDPDSDEPEFLLDYCLIDFSDWDYTVNYSNADVFFKYYSDNNITCQFNGPEISISHECANRDLKIWKQITGVSPCSYTNNIQNKGNFKTTTETNYNSYLYFPIKASDYAGFPQHLNYGSLFLNFSVASGHHAYIKQNETMYIESGATFTVQNNAILTFQSNSTLYIKRGGKFCNNGTVNGNIRIIYERVGIYNYCSPAFTPFIGGNVTIEDSAIVEFPDSTTIVFDSTAVFTMMPHSELRMGKHSKIIFQNGSRIKCNNAKITSLDSTHTWDGIYLSDDANDTIKNCVIQNAYNGINVSEPSSISLTNYTTEITNCTFKNSTSTQLLNQVYIDGSSGVLVKGCSTESGISSGFASCIVMQYCPSGSVVIADNNFSNCDIGITAIQSSPYIARNIITGLTGSGIGLYLDNSNGTIEYNIVNNFEKSIECGYSSPYLLKNTFNDASDMIVQLYSSSVPVMRPVNSGTVIRWLGGNNTLSGMPTTGAFVLEKESYPMMDSGYNKILTNGYNYVSGDLDGDLDAGMNHWQDNPPNTAYYAVSGGDVIYDPVFNGTSLPSMDYYDLNSLGFGMYDSVFVIDNGDNPLAGSLFMQAYSNEMSGNYSTAITKYKDVVTEYKTSTYATVSLARIFNCLEKNNSSVSDYSNIQGYYASIKYDTNNTKESREISEDFVIKSKVRQGNFMEAVSDYENIYQNNQNTHKGTHALLNKLCLLKYGSGGDNPNGSSGTESKIDILSLISGKSLSQNVSNNTNNTPRTFKLHQNYPNPFNPTTNIKYDIPRDANVSIKIYDLLGREVFSVSEYKTAGSHEVLFDGSNLASGLYFYSLEASPSTGLGRGYFETKKMVLVK